MRKSRKEEIYNFCHDLYLMWSRCQGYTFGEFISDFVELYDCRYISDAEIIDLIREFLDKEN